MIAWIILWSDTLFVLRRQLSTCNWFVWTTYRSWTGWNWCLRPYTTLRARAPSCMPQHNLCQDGQTHFYNHFSNSLLCNNPLPDLKDEWTTLKSSNDKCFYFTISVSSLIDRLWISLFKTKVKNLSTSKFDTLYIKWFVIENY